MFKVFNLFISILDHVLCNDTAVVIHAPLIEPQPVDFADGISGCPIEQWEITHNRFPLFLLES